MDRLPAEVLVKILSYLPSNEIFSVMRVSKQFNYLIKRNWRKMNHNVRRRIEFGKCDESNIRVNISDKKAMIWFTTEQRSLEFVVGDPDNGEPTRVRWSEDFPNSNNDQSSGFTFNCEQFLKNFLRYWNFTEMRFERMDLTLLNRCCELLVLMGTKVKRLLICDCEPSTMMRLVTSIESESISWNSQDHVHGSLNDLLNTYWPRRLYAPKMCTDWPTVITAIHKFLSTTDQTSSFCYCIVRGEDDFLAALRIYNLTEITEDHFSKFGRKYFILNPTNQREVHLTVSTKTKECDCGPLATIKFGCV